MSSTQQLLLGEGAGGGIPNFIEEVFSTYLYAGNSSTQTITNSIDLSTKGGLVWIKQRSAPSTAHSLTDTARGAGKQLFSNNTNAEDVDATVVSAFTSTGFSLGSYANTNASTENYVSWTFREQPKFFDIVTYTGNGVAGRTVAHNLGVVPGCMIIKPVSTAGEWRVWHRGLAAPATSFLYLNRTDAVVTGSTIWDSTNPTSTEFTVSSSASNNGNGTDYVAYLFAHDAGGFGTSGTDNVISCGGFTSDGSGNATVSLGYEPQWIFTKRTNSATDWQIYDNMRGFTADNVAQQVLYPNLTSVEGGGFNYATNSTGFSLTGVNASDQFIYIAIRRGPMKVPTAGTSVFDADFGNNVTVANTSVFSSAITTDLLLYLLPAGGGPYFYDRLRGGDNELRTSSTATETTGAFPNFDAQTGVNSDTVFNFTSRVGDVFRRAPGYFDIVCYTGTGVARTVTHNLAAVPELYIVKRRAGSETGGIVGYWVVYASPLGNTKALFLNTTDSSQGTSVWNNTTPTSTTFTVDNNYVNYSGDTYVAYLFATCAGVSKIGSYTGTGTTLQINCGFTSGARFVLIKRTSSGGGDWYVWDSARGITSGDDPYILLNSNAAEVTGTDYVDTYSAGFEISSTAPSAINASGGTFIFLAIA